MLYRYLGSPSCRAQPLRPGRSMGSSERIYSNPVLRPICSYLLSQDQGWPVHAWFRRQGSQTCQPHQGRSATTPNLLQQPCTSGFWSSCPASCSRARSIYWVPGAFYTRHTYFLRVSDEPSECCQSQSSVFILFSPICLSRTVNALARGHADGSLTKASLCGHKRRLGDEECKLVC